MVKGQLIMALDFEKDKNTKHGKASRLVDGVWHVFSFGPGYSNTFKVSEFDDAGLKWLKDNEEKDNATERNK